MGLKSIEEHSNLSDYAVIVSDDRENRQLVGETMFMSQFFDAGEKWSFYKSYNLEFPSDEELKNLKGIFFSGSKYSVYDKT